MQRFWLKIGFGAFGIFLVGMLLVTLGRQAKAAATDAIASAVTSHLSATTDAAKDLPFRLAGAEIGNIERASMQRVASGAMPEVNLLVRLSDAAMTRELQDCVLVPAREDHVDLDRGFRCAEGLTGGLVEIGRVQFEPGSFHRPLMVSRPLSRDLSTGKPFTADADLSAGVRVNVTGENGELVRLFADSTGAVLRVRDDKGRDVVRLDAGHGRLSLSVDTTGH